MLFLAFCEANCQFDTPFQIVHIQGNQRVAGTHDFADQLADLGAAHEQLSGPNRIRTNMGRCSEQWRNVGPEQPELAISNDHISFLDLGPTGADRFHFPTLEDQARLVAFLDKVVVIGLAVFDDRHVASYLPLTIFKYMAVVTRSVLLPHTARQMFDLVADVTSYPGFLPWCGEARVCESSPEGMTATLTIAFKGLRQSFTTRNDHIEGQRIGMRLVDGPFAMLTGEWTFTPLSESACRVDFQLDYRFSNSLLEKVVGSVFDPIAKSFVDAFVRRADELYGID